MKPTLYNIDGEILELLEVAASFDEETPPEIVDEWLAQFEENKLERKDKVDNILRYTKSLDAWNVGLDVEIKRLTELKTSTTKKSNRLLQYLELSMKNAQETELQTDLFKLKFVKNPSKLILSEAFEKVMSIDVNEADANLRELKTALSERKKDIKEKLKNGEVVNGASMEQSERLRIQ